MAEQVRSRVRAGHVVVWAAVIPFALWALGRVVGVDGFSPAAQLMAFTPYVAAASIIPVVAAVILRQWWPVAVAALACAALVVCVLPRALGSPSTMDGVAATVMSMNMLEGGADAPSVVTLVRERRVDVLTLQEFTSDAELRLAVAGLTGLLPYHVSQPITDIRGSGLYARFPLVDTGTVLNAGGFYQAHATVQVPGAQPVAVVSVHPLAPATFDSVALWRTDLRAQRPAPSGGTPLILAGDFNATLDHSELRRIIATGYHDAAATVGKGLTPTWPFYGPRSAITPKVTLDHVLVDTRIGVADFGAYTVARTDHRAVIARVILPKD